MQSVLSMGCHQCLVHTYVDISLYPLRRMIKIGFISGFNFFTDVPGRTKCPAAPASEIASILVIFNTDVEYAVSIGVDVRLLGTITFHHHICHYL